MLFRSARLAAHRIYEGGRWRRAWLLDREKLRAGDRFAGPLVITELSATTFVPSGWTGTVDAHSNLILIAGGRR